jgi:FkbH-like protein
MYLAEAERRSLQTSAASLEDYLRSLQMELTIREADSLSTPRIAQLTQKTNQFNLTTRRYSESEITQLASSRDFGVYYAQLRDRFDDSGIIAVAILRREASKAHIDTLLMSCRVIGRGVESALLAHIAARATELGASELVGEYLPTAKNSLVANLFPEHGFAQGAGHDWRLKLPASLNTPSWFREAHSITTQK